MEETAKEGLCENLATVDRSLLFLILIIFATLLAFWSVVIQRRQLCLTVQGETEAAAAAPEVYPIKHASSAIVVGSLGFFLCLALRTAREAAQGDDCVAQRSASTNVWASLFVLVAALLRLCDLEYVEGSRQSALLEEDTLPD